MRKTRRNWGRNGGFYVINNSSTTEQPAEFHTGEELTRKNNVKLPVDNLR
jgi:hypothetical protein